MSYYAKDYIPSVERNLSPTESEIVLDLFNARYIKAFKNVSAYTTHTITFKDAGRLDLVCNQYYEDRPDLIQALARFNKIINPLTEVRVGLRLLIPPSSALEQALENANTKEINENTYITLR